MEKQLQAAVGYLELGMVQDSANEIECIPPAQKNSSPVLRVRLEIYRAAEKWNLAEVVAKELWKRNSDDPVNWNNLATAVRRATGLSEAHQILTDALRKFPDDPTTNYNLGCYHCQLGDLESAKERVGDAIKFDPKFKVLALDDPDLEPLWSMWSQT
jgi:predicted Zn-dependent protease